MEAFRAMFKWLASNMWWESGHARCRKAEGNYQVCLFGTGSIAADHYQTAHTLAQQHDPQLEALMVKVEDAQKILDDAVIGLDHYIRCRTEKAGLDL
jgi:hypothetical protein